MGESHEQAGADRGPLTGRTILVTRARHQAAALVDALEKLGARVLVAPVIETIEPSDWAPADNALGQLDSYDWAVFTSANAVDRFAGRMRDTGIPIERLGAIGVAAVGPATAGRLLELGITPGVVPDDHRAEGLVEAFARLGVGPRWRIVIPRAEKAREILPESLRAAGAQVDVVAVYRTMPAVPAPSVIDALRAGDVDAITFTSPSTVRHFFAWAGGSGLAPADVMSRAVAASIGPVTSVALEALGYRERVEAAEFSAAGLVDAIRRRFGAPS